MPGTDIVYRGWGFMGPSLPAGDVPRGGFLQGGLLSVPQHLWGTDTTVQRQGAWGEELTALTSVHTHPHTDWQPWRPARPRVFRGLHQHIRGKGPSRGGWGSPAKQAAENEFIWEGGPAEEGASAQLASLREGLQHRRPAPEAPTPQLLDGTRGGESAATQVPQGGLRTHDSVYRRPVPAQPSAHAVPCSSPHAQPTALSWAARGQPACEAAEDERWPLKNSTDLHPQTDRRRHAWKQIQRCPLKKNKKTDGLLTIDFLFLETQPFTGTTVIFLCFIGEAFMQALLHTKQQENTMLNANLIILRQLCTYTLNPLFIVCTTTLNSQS